MVFLVLAAITKGVLGFGFPLLAVPAAAAIACAPVVAGVTLGMRLRARLQAAAFRRVVLVVIVLSALNLIRQGLWG